MIVLTAVLLALLLIFGPVIYWLNKATIARYGRPAFGLMQAIYVAVAFVIFCVGIGNLPKEFQLSHQAPMSAEELAVAKAAWADEISEAEQELLSQKQRLQAAVDPLEKKDAAQRISEAKAALDRYRNGAAPITKTVWTPGVLMNFLDFPIARSLEIPALCFGVSLSVILGMFIYNGIQMDWLTASVVLVLQVALAIPLLLFAFMAAKALQNHQARRGF